jgi:hypothetical protein
MAQPVTVTPGGGQARAGQVIVFTGDRSAFHGTGVGGREWLTQPATTGWVLRFRDPGDRTWTYAGTYAGFEQACAEANR